MSDTSQLNVERKRWYGIRVGDVVDESAFGSTRRGTVVGLHIRDNNGIDADVGRDKLVKMIPEWCTVIEPVRDQRCFECGGFVASVFDHVDRECPPRD